ncbi:hypothetical protein EA74_02368 [Enterococcus hirae]|nr:hypothetical protein EA74_02368 [Enterococcus hirae]
MNALKNKRHTIVSLILTTITIIFTSFYFIPYME